MSTLRLSARTAPTQRPARGRRRADAPATVDPTVVGNVARVVAAVAAVAYALVLAVLLPVGTSAVVFLLTATPVWLAWPGLVARVPALLGGAR